MNLSDSKRGQLVTFKRMGTVTYGLVLGVADEELKDVIDVEDVDLKHTQMGIYLLCKYESFLNISEDKFLVYLQSTLEDILEKPFNDACYKNVSVVSLTFVKQFIDEGSLTIWLLKNQMLSKDVNKIISNLKLPKDRLKQYKQLKQQLNQYQNNENVTTYLETLKEKIKNRDKKVTEFHAMNIYLREYEKKLSFVIPLVHGNVLELPYKKQNPETSLILSRKLDFYLNYCYIRSRDVERRKINNGTFYDLNESISDIDYNRFKILKILESYGIK